MSKPKNIMREFKMDEISVVDRPAQKGAKMTIMKRDDNLENHKELNMSDSTLETVTKALEDSKAEVEALKKSLADATIIASFSESEKAYFDKAADKDAFLALSADERKKKVEDVKKADESIVVSGQTIVKSEVGPAVFAVLKAQDEKAKDNEARLAKAEKEAAFVKFEKRASEEFGNLPGTDLEKAEVLEAVAGLDEKIAKRLDEILKAANEATKGAFKEAGVRKAAAEGDSLAKRDAKVDEIMKRDKISKHAAIDRALVEAPELFV